MGGVTHFGISEGKGGLKHGSRLWLGMDIFWNCPFQAFAAILRQMELISTNVKHNSGQVILPVLNFVYHSSKPWSDWFAHVKNYGKQPISLLNGQDYQELL